MNLLHIVSVLGLWVVFVRLYLGCGVSFSVLLVSFNRLEGLLAAASVVVHKRCSLICSVGKL